MGITLFVGVGGLVGSGNLANGAAPRPRPREPLWMGHPRRRNRRDGGRRHLRERPHGRKPRRGGPRSASLARRSRAFAGLQPRAGWHSTSISTDRGCGILTFVFLNLLSFVLPGPWRSEKQGRFSVSSPRQHRNGDGASSGCTATGKAAVLKDIRLHTLYRMSGTRTGVSERDRRAGLPSVWLKKGNPRRRRNVEVKRHTRERTALPLGPVLCREVGLVL